MQHVDSDFAPIRKSQKVVDSGKIVRAINDDLEHKNFTILRKLSLVPIKGNANSSRVSERSSIEKRVDHGFYREFKSVALEDLSDNYSSVSYIAGLNKFLTNDLGKMEGHIVFFNQIKHIHQYAGIDRRVSEILSLVDLNVVTIDMNDYFIKGIFPPNILSCYAKTRKKFRYKAQLDFGVSGNASDDTFDLMMMIIREISQNSSLNHIICFRFEQLDESSSSNVIVPSKLTEFKRILLSLQRIKNIAFKFLVYSNNTNISSLLFTTFKNELKRELTIFEIPVLTSVQVQEHLKKMIKFPSDPGNELLQLYNTLIARQLDNKKSCLVEFLEFLKDFPHPFTYLFNAYTEILVQSKTFDGLLDRINNKFTMNNYPHRSYNFKRNQRLPPKMTRGIHDI